MAAQVACKDMGKDNSTTCPAGCQDAIDATYADCGGTCTLKGEEWDVRAAATAATLTTTGCSGAVAAAPVFALVAAAMTFFN